MRVLMLNAFHWPKGGVERTYLDESRWLAAAGHEVTVMDYDDTGDCEPVRGKLSRTGIGTVTVERTPYTDLPVLKYLG